MKKLRNIASLALLFFFLLPLAIHANSDSTAVGFNVDIIDEDGFPRAIASYPIAYLPALGLGIYPQPIAATGGFNLYNIYFGDITIANTIDDTRLQGQQVGTVLNEILTTRASLSYRRLLVSLGSFVNYEGDEVLQNSSLDIRFQRYNPSIGDRGVFEPSNLQPLYAGAAPSLLFSIDRSVEWFTIGGSTLNIQLGDYIPRGSISSYLLWTSEVGP